MKNMKIDKTLLTHSYALSDKQSIDCIVKASDYQRLKKYLIHKKIEIVREYLFINSFQLKVTKTQLLA